MSTMVGRVWVTSPNDSQYGGEEKRLRMSLTSGRASLRARFVSFSVPKLFMSAASFVALGLIHTRSGPGCGLGLGRGWPFVFLAMSAISEVDIDLFILDVREVSVSLGVSGLCSRCPVEGPYKWGRSVSFIYCGSIYHAILALHCPQQKAEIHHATWLIVRSFFRSFTGG